MSSPHTIKSNLKNFDFLRGFLILYIVLGHAIWLLIEYSTNTALLYLHKIFSFGTSAAFVFLIISGFSIHNKFAQQIASHKSLYFDSKKFLKSRCLRILPPYYLALLITVLCDSIGRFLYPSLYLGQTGSSLLNQQMSAMQFTASSIIQALFLVPSSHGNHFGSNGVLWFFTLLIAYYLLYMLWIKVRIFNAVLAYSSTIIIAFFAAYFLPQHIFLRTLLMIFPCWLTGAALSEIFQKNKLPDKAYIVGLFVAFFGLIAVYFGDEFLNMNIFNFPLQIFFHTILAVGLVTATAFYPTRKSPNYAMKIIEFIGKESYTLFLCHFPMLIFISAWSFEKSGKRPSNIWLFVGGTCCVVYACHLFYLLCEKRFQNRRPLR